MCDSWLHFIVKLTLCYPPRLPEESDDGPLEAGDGRVLVQLWKEADAPSLVYGVPSVAPLD